MGDPRQNSGRVLSFTPLTMLQASAQAVDFKVGRYFGEGQRPSTLRCSQEGTFPLDSNSKPHLLRVSAARKRVSIGRAFIFSLLAELVSAIPCSP